MNSWPWILAFAVAIGALVAGVEIGARYLLRRSPYYVWPPGLRLHLHPDPAVSPELEPVARIEINADGERGDAVPRSGRRVYRVLVAGGSPAECALLDQPTTWPGALQRLLGAPEHLRALGVSAVHVGNIGRSGVSSHGLNLIFERILTRSRHRDLIVIMVGGNDVFDWLAREAPPSYIPHRIPAAELFSSHPEASFGWTLRKLALTRLLRTLRWRWFHPVKNDYASGSWVAKARAMRARARETRTVIPDPTAMVRHFEDQLRELLGRAKSHADRVLVVRQPWFEKDYTREESAQVWHGGVGNPHRDDVTVYYSVEILCWLMALLSERAACVAEELGVEHLDLKPLLDPSLKTYYDFVHFTPAGAAVVANAVAAAILLRPAPAERTPVEAVRAAAMRGS